MSRGRLPIAAVLTVLIVGIQVLFVFCLTYPPLHASPHGVPIGVAGPAPSAQRAARSRTAPSMARSSRPRPAYGCS